MMQIVDEAYLRQIAAQPDGYARLHAMLAEAIARAETAEAVAKACVSDASTPHPILAEIMAEVAKATAKFPTWPTRIVDAGNVVAEEAGELAKAVLQSVYEPHKSSIADVREEAIQTAAMCFRFLVSMDRYTLDPCEQHVQRSLEPVGQQP